MIMTILAWVVGSVLLAFVLGVCVHNGLDAYHARKANWPHLYAKK